jgi:PAS domain-containing protein
MPPGAPTGNIEAMPLELSNRLRLLESALSLSPDGVIVVDFEERPVFANDVARTIVGQALDFDAALSRQLAGFHLIGPDGQSAPLAESPFAFALAGSVLRDIRATFDRSNGSEARVVIAASPVRDEASQIVGAAVLLRETGRLERVEETLRDTEQRYHALLDAIPDAAHFKDATGRYVLVNAAMAESVHLSKDEIVGRGALEVHPPSMNMANTK